MHLKQRELRGTGVPPTSPFPSCHSARDGFKSTPLDFLILLLASGSRHAATGPACVPARPGRAKIIILYFSIEVVMANCATSSTASPPSRAGALLVLFVRGIL